MALPDRLGVRSSREGVAASLEVVTELLEVVNLSVEDHGLCPVLIEDWLASAGDVDDAEATVTQAHARPVVEARGIGTSMRYDGGHPADDGPGHRAGVGLMHDAGNATHDQSGRPRAIRSPVAPAAFTLRCA